MQSLHSKSQRDISCLALSIDSECLTISLAQLEPVEESCAQAAIDPDLSVSGILPIAENMSSIKLLEINKVEESSYEERGGGGSSSRKSHRPRMFTLADIAKMLGFSGFGRRLDKKSRKREKKRRKQIRKREKRRRKEMKKEKKIQKKLEK